MSTTDHLTMSNSQDVEVGAQFSAITCSICGSSLRLLMPVPVNDLVAVTNAMLTLHRHDGTEDDDDE